MAVLFEASEDRSLSLLQSKSDKQQNTDMDYITENTKQYKTTGGSTDTGPSSISSNWSVTLKKQTSLCSLIKQYL